MFVGGRHFFSRKTTLFAHRALGFPVLQIVMTNISRANKNDTYLYGLWPVDPEGDICVGL